MSKREAPGRMVRTEAGYDAFVPSPLPPRLAWNERLARMLSEADRMIGRLSGIAGQLPEPSVLTRPFVRREAVLSSRIEGTRTTLPELLASEAGARERQDSEDLREVENCALALEYGLARLTTLPVSVELILELHQRLMTDVRGGRASPGALRREQNWIGSPGCTPFDAVYVPPPPEEVRPCLVQWTDFLRDRSMPVLVQVGLLHYQFEAIHPFRDGNGRVGRLLVALLLAERGVLKQPLLSLSAYIDATREEYYDRLLGVSRRGEWEEWLEYFLVGVARESEDAISRAERITGLLAGWRKQAADAGRAALQLLDLIAGNPYVTIGGVASKLRVAFTTAQRAVDALVESGVLAPVSDAKRSRVYCARALLDVLDEPMSSRASSRHSPRTEKPSTRKLK
jgi:Fic family protein